MRESSAWEAVDQRWMALSRRSCGSVPLVAILATSASNDAKDGVAPRASTDRSAYCATASGRSPSTIGPWRRVYRAATDA